MVGTGFEDTKENCDAYLISGHLALSSIEGIGYGADKLGVTKKHHQEDRYFCILNKESFPKWETILELLMTTEQLKNYGDVDLGTPPTYIS